MVHMLQTLLIPVQLLVQQAVAQVNRGEPRILNSVPELWYGVAMSTISKLKHIEASITGKFRYRSETIVFIN